MGANNFTLRYKKVANSSLTVVCRDIDTMADIETKTIPGNTGESVSLDGSPDGYEAAGELPESATISSNESNNTIYLYYKKIVEKPDVKKEVPYTIRFRAYGDNDTMVMTEVTGTWTLGERLPYYFAKVYNDAQGRTWTAVGDSPQILRSVIAQQIFLRSIQTDRTARRDRYGKEIHDQIRGGRHRLRARNHNRNRACRRSDPVYEYFGQLWICTDIRKLSCNFR